LDTPERAAAQASATLITSNSDVEHVRQRRYFFSAGLSELALLFPEFSEDAEESLLFELSDLLSEEEPDADPFPPDEFPLAEEDDFFA
jgi:hypothetical protein